MVDYEQERETSPLLLKAEEAAKLLSISPAMVRKLAAAGELPVVRLGAAVRIPVEPLHKWLDARTIPHFAQDDSPQD